MTTQTDFEKWFKEHDCIVLEILHYNDIKQALKEAYEAGKVKGSIEMCKDHDTKVCADTVKPILPLINEIEMATQKEQIRTEVIADFMKDLFKIQDYHMDEGPGFCWTVKYLVEILRKWGLSDAQINDIGLDIALLS